MPIPLYSGVQIWTLVKCEVRTAKSRSGKMQSERRNCNAKWRIIREVAKKEFLFILSGKYFVIP